MTSQLALLITFRVPEYTFSVLTLHPARQRNPATALRIHQNRPRARAPKPLLLKYLG